MALGAEERRDDERGERCRRELAVASAAAMAERRSSGVRMRGTRFAWPTELCPRSIHGAVPERVAGRHTRCPGPIAVAARNHMARANPCVNEADVRAELSRR
jgi:hypothetical protein